MKNPTNRAGTTLVELLITVVVLITLSLIIAPALGTMRAGSNNEVSRANLMQIGQGRDAYAMNNGDRIFSYTWRAGEAYILPDGRTKIAASDQEAAANQNTEILMRRTGRISGIYKIRTAFNRLPHRRFTHLVLLDDLAGDDDQAFVNPIGIDPGDQNQLVWSERPLEYLQGSGVPYAAGSNAGYDDDPNWSGVENKQRWAFGSSYQAVPFAWQGDGPDNVYIPIASTPHLFSSQGSPELGRRLMSEVAFPAQKVHMHEEFDREQKRYPYFAYDHAAVEKLMFDGSVNGQISGEANSSVNPAQPGREWMQRYVPLDAFPIPLGGFNDSTLLNMRFRWTEGGLQGIDYD